MRANVTHNRIGILALCLLAGFALAGFRLFYLQLYLRSELLAKADSQSFFLTKIPAKRGTIYDRHGAVLAESLVTESVFLNVRQVRNRAQVAERVGRALKISPAWLRARMAGRKSFWVKRNARSEDVSALKDARLDCLSFFPEAKRYYPLGGLASHVLGFTDIDGRGLEGVEKQYDAELKGSAGVMRASRDARGRAELSNFQVEKAAREGAGITLTLDAQLQYIAERELEKAFKKFRPRRASLVMMDPASGEILALANRPAFNCNHPERASDFERRDTAISDTYEPGSTFKVVTAALALQEGLVSPDTPVNCRFGKARILGRMVKDDEGTLGVVPFEEVMAQSSNIGIVTVALKLGKQRLYDGARRFGFGERTGVDLPGEAPGLLRPVAEWSGISLAALPFGQEMSCNLLHVACLYAPFANGGRTVVPHVVGEIRPQGGWPSGPRLSRSGGNRVLSSWVQREVRKMLEGVVDHGTGTPAGLPDFLVAGKTGTSEKFDARRNAYSFDKNCSSFVGFVPSEHPKFLMAVMLDEPHGLTLGGWVAGPVFREVASAALAAWKVAPEGEARAAGAGRKVTSPAGPAAAAQVKVPNLMGLKAPEAKRQLTLLGLKPRPRGVQGKVVSQFPKAGCPVRRAASVSYLLQNGGARRAAGDKALRLQLAKGR